MTEKHLTISLCEDLTVSNTSGTLNRNSNSTQWLDIVLDGWRLNEGEQLYIELSHYDDETELTEKVGPLLLLSNKNLGRYVTLAPPELVCSPGEWQFSIELRYDIDENGDGDITYNSLTSAIYIFQVNDSIITATKANSYVKETELISAANTLAGAVLAGHTAEDAVAASRAARLSAEEAERWANTAKEFTESGISFNTGYTSFADLPEEGDSRFIYLIPNGNASPNFFDEYIWLSNKGSYEKIGTTEIDLSSYVTKIQQEKEKAKSYYNLGAYDTVKHNGDGTATVTRQTGYLEVTNADIRTRNGSQSGGGLAWYDCEKIHLPTQDITANLYSSAANSWTSTTPNVTVQSNGNIRIYSDKINLQEFREWLAENPVCVQYKLSAPYTEKVIVNQPIHTLDQSGEQWLREEWEKGLNLAKPILKSVTTSLNLKVMAVAKTTPGKRYCWSGSYTKSGEDVVAGFGGIYILPSSGPDINGTYPDNYNNKYGDSYEQLSQSWNATFTATDEYALIVVGTTGVTAEFNVSNLMLNEGDSAYPYLPYSGEIVREKDLESFVAKSGDAVAGNLVVNGQQFTKGSIKGTHGALGYVKVAKIEIKGTYCNAPIIIELSNRFSQLSSKIFIEFYGTNDLTPDVEFFYVMGSTNLLAYLSRDTENESIWYLIVKKSEAYDSIQILDYRHGTYNNIEVTWLNDLISSLPTLYKTPEHWEYNRNNLNINLNGSKNMTPDFYAPTSAGGFGQLLKSNGTGAPVWVGADSYSTGITSRIGQCDTVVEYYRSSGGVAWRRIWASGWKEVGGIISMYNSNADIDCNGVTFSNADYGVQLSFGGTVKRDSMPSVYDKTINKFKVIHGAGLNSEFCLYWYAFGY